MTTDDHDSPRGPLQGTADSLLARMPIKAPAAPQGELSEAPDGLVEIMLLLTPGQAAAIAPALDLIADFHGTHTTTSTVLAAIINYANELQGDYE